MTLHYTTLHYTALHCTTLHYTALHCTTLHYTALHCNYTATTLPYTRLRYTIPHYSYTALHDITVHYTTLITAHHGYNCNCTCMTLITLDYSYSSTTPLQLQLQLQLLLQLRYATLHPAAVVRWPLKPLQPLKNTQLQPPVGPSVDSLCHPWFTTTNLSYRFPIFETSATALCETTGNKNSPTPRCFFVSYGFLQSNMLVFELRF